MRDLPAEGLLGAIAPRPSGAALRAFNVAARRCRTLIFFCRGFELGPNAVDRNFAVLGHFCGICRLRDSNKHNKILFRKRF